MMVEGEAEMSREQEKKVRFMVVCKDAKQKARLTGYWHMFKELCLSEGIDPVDQLVEILKKAAEEKYKTGGAP